MAVFRHFNTDKDGWVSFDEFQAALVRLNFVGVQREVCCVRLC
jgi:EF-hand domain